MPLYEASIVSLESIPAPPYSTPSGDLHKLYCTAKGMEALCIKMNGTYFIRGVGAILLTKFVLYQKRLMVEMR